MDGNEPEIIELENIPPAYWLLVCNGSMAVVRLFQTSAEEMIRLFEEFPILILPEFDATLRTFLEGTNPEFKPGRLEAVKLLGELREFLRREFPETYADRAGACAEVLAAEERADRVVNLRRAIGLCHEARSLVPPGHWVFAACFNIEGVAYNCLAELGLSPLKYLRRAMRLFSDAREHVPTDDVLLGHTLINEAGALVSLADLGIDSRANLEEALRLNRQAQSILPPDTPELTATLMNSGTAHELLAEMGFNATSNLGEAIRLYDEACSRYSSDSRSFVRCLVNAANARLRLAELGLEPDANLEESVRFFQQARALSPPKTQTAAKCLTGEAGVRVTAASLGIDARTNLDEAFRLCSRARPLLLPDSPSFASCSYNEASVHRGLAELGIDAPENLQTAVRLYQEAGDCFRKAGLQFKAIDAFKYLALIAESHKDWEAVMVAVQQAIQASEDVRGSTRLLRERETWMGKTIEVYKAATETSLRLERYGPALEYVEKGRSRVLVDLLHMQEMEPQNVPLDDIEKYRQARWRADELAAILSRDKWLEGDERAKERLAFLMQEQIEISQRLRFLEDELRQRDPDFFSLANPLTLTEMIALARDLHRALVLFWVGPDRAAVFFVGSSGEFDHLLLPNLRSAVLNEWMSGSPGERAGGWVTKYQQYRQGRLTRRAWIDQMDQTLNQISEQLMMPVRHWLNTHNETRVAFVVAGQLGMLPLHAASWTENNMTHYFIEEFEVLYAPSAWVLKRCVERQRRGSLSVLAVANPQLSGIGLLPFGEWEVQQIAGPLQDKIGEENFRFLVGESATIERITDELGSCAIAHFSCHAEWDFEEPLQSSLMLTGTKLTLAHLFRHTRLQNTRLVVLSACESGPSHRRESAAEEFLGLPTGFIFAGAKSVVGSLWRVLDPPTALLMREFYRNLLNGAEATAALRQAQLWLMRLTRDDAVSLMEPSIETIATRSTQDLMEGYRAWMMRLEDPPFAHPYYWAAFEMFGSPEALA